MKGFLIVIVFLQVLHDDALELGDALGVGVTNAVWVISAKKRSTMLSWKAEAGVKGKWKRA